MSSKRFDELFNIEEIQKIQDSFARATGVASIITDTDGTPITKPSNFCRLCSDIIRKTEVGLCNCFRSDSIIGSFNPDGPTIQKCLSGGLWDSGASITVNGVHIANWLIGQVRNEEYITEEMLEYADKIGADKREFKDALKEVTIMPLKKFEDISNTLFLFSNLLSQLAFDKLENESLNIELNNQNRELLKIQNDLRNSEERFKSLVETTNDWIWELDKNAVFTYVSPGVENLLGFKPEEIIGKSGYDLMPPEEAAIISREFDKFVTRKKPFYNLRNINIHKDGRRVILESSGKPFFDSKGNLLGYRGVDRDITARLKTQELIIQSEKMMSIGGLAAGMAHEINNPLAAIIQSVQNIERRLSPSFIKNKKAAENFNLDLESVSDYLESRDIFSFIDAIKDAGIRAAGIVKNMLNFSRQSQATLSEVNINSLIDKVLDLASHDYNVVNDFDFRQITINKKYEEDIPLIKCVKSEIEQVILNILKNGAEVMLDSSRQNPVVHSPEFFISTGSDNENIYIEIEDNGPGINIEQQKRIFDPFYTTKPVGKGTGLGLSVSYYIITQNHRGKMSIDSEVGKFAKFSIALPR